MMRAMSVVHYRSGETELRVIGQANRICFVVEREHD